MQQWNMSLHWKQTEEENYVYNFGSMFWMNENDNLN